MLRSKPPGTGRLETAAISHRPPRSWGPGSPPLRQLLYVSARLLSSDGSADPEGCPSYVALSWGGGAPSTQAEPLGPRSAGVLGPGAPGGGLSPWHILLCGKAVRSPQRGQMCNQQGGVRAWSRGLGLSHVRCVCACVCVGGVTTEDFHEDVTLQPRQLRSVWTGECSRRVEVYRREQRVWGVAGASWAASPGAGRWPRGREGSAEGPLSREPASQTRFQGP